MSVLVISIDDLAAFAFVKNLHAGEVHTPNIDRIMSMGTTFQNGFAQVAMCNASRTSMMTGLSPAHTGVHQNAISYWDAVDADDLLMSSFMGAGFHTSMIGKVMHAPQVPDEYAARFTNYIFEQRGGVGGREIGVLPEDERASNGDEVNIGEALRLLGSYDPSDPFAMFVGINKPHLNWVVPQEFYDLYPLESIVMVENPEGDLGDLPPMAAWATGERRWEINPADAGPEAMQAYLAAISYADHLVGQLLDQLDANGLTDSTTIVLWSDHGYHLGDKDHWGKFTLWESAARAPFVIAQPGNQDDGQVVDQAVELVDIMPTLLDISGLEVPEGLDGRSLVDFIENPALLDDGVAITSMNGGVSIRTNEWRYTRYPNGDEELYAASDVHNHTNLAADPEYADVVSAMSGRLFAEAAADGWVLGTTEGELFGTDAAETLVPYREHTLYGGGGDDLYQVLWTGHGYASVVEYEGGGYDTLRTDQNEFTIPDHVERVSALNGSANIIGNGSDNLILGGSYLSGMDGDDKLVGRRGDDTLIGGAGNDNLAGGIGWDTADYSASESAIHLRWMISHSDTEGRDTLTSIERVIGSDFADTIYGTTNADTMVGGAGADFLNGENGADRLDGGNHNDVLVGRTGNDSLYGGAGWDTLEGGAGNDLLHGGNGNDRASYLSAWSGVTVSLALEGAQNTLGSGWDTLVSIEYLTGSAFGDTLTGSSGNNQIFGAGGADHVLGGFGDDLLLGQDGDDVIEGQAGWDTLRGDDGNDTLIGGNGGDMLLGGDGIDMLSGNSGFDRIYGGSGGDIISGGADRDLLFGEAGHDTISGDGGNDLLLGNNGDDTLDGGDGNDVVNGGAGNDMMTGGDGDDILLGNWGVDTMTGGTGADTFLFKAGHTGSFENLADTILDFSRVEGDIIDLSQIDAIAGGGDDAFAFIGDTAFSGTAGELRYTATENSLMVKGDTDGDGVADLLIAVDGLPDLTNSDFVL